MRSVGVTYSVGVAVMVPWSLSMKATLDTLACGGDEFMFFRGGCGPTC